MTPITKYQEAVEEALKSHELSAKIQPKRILENHRLVTAVAIHQATYQLIKELCGKEEVHKQPDDDKSMAFERVKLGRNSLRSEILTKAKELVK
jgi:hypothetical protein